MGSTFLIELPLHEVPPERSESDLPVLGGRVLIVDDLEVSRDISSEHVASWGMRAAAVSSASEALSELREAERSNDRFAVALLWHDPPQIDALELARDLMRESPSGSFGVVLYGTRQHRKVVAGAGVGAYLSQPLRAPDLLDAIMGARQPAPPATTGESVTVLTADLLQVTVEGHAAQSELRGRVLVAEDNNRSRALGSACTTGQRAFSRRSGGRSHLPVGSGQPA